MDVSVNDVIYVRCLLLAHINTPYNVGHAGAGVSYYNNIDV